MKKVFIQKELTDVKRKNRYFLLILLFAFWVYNFFVNPYQAGFLSCYFKDFTGYPCPTCGMSRSMYYATHFNLAEALSFHPFGPLLLILTFLIIIKFISELFFQKEFILNLSGRLKFLSILFFMSVWFGFWLTKFF